MKTIYYSIHKSMVEVIKKDSWQLMESLDSINARNLVIEKKILNNQKPFNG